MTRETSLPTVTGRLKSERVQGRDHRPTPDQPAAAGPHGLAVHLQQPGLALAFVAAFAGIAQLYGLDPEIRYAGGRVEVRLDPAAGADPPDPDALGQLQALLASLARRAEGGGR